MSAVTIEQVTKTFRQHVAVDNLSLEVPRGSIYGFIGPNGSGKTTTLRMIMRILLPDSGVLRVLDEPVDGERNSRSILDRVAYLPEERGLYKQMKVRDVLRFYAELKGCRRSRPAIDAWLERMDLSAWANKKVETLSKGMAQKVQFIATVIAQPELILLDEPFSGLDPVNTEVFRKEILELRRNGATIVFSTHDMAVAEKLCDFLFMIHKGKKVLDGTLESIQDAYGSDTLRVQLDEPAVGQAFQPDGQDRQAGKPDLQTMAVGQAFQPDSSDRQAGKPDLQAMRLEDLPEVVKVTDLGRWQELRLTPAADSQQILALLMRRGRVRHFETIRPTLADIFVRIAQPDFNEVDKIHA